MQLAQVAVDEELTLRIYVLAGDSRFAYMWGILAQKAVGYLVVVDGEREESVAAARALLRSVGGRTGVPYVIGVTSGDLDDAEHRAVVARQIGAEAQAAVVPLRCAERESIKEALCTLLRRVQQQVRQAAGPQ